VLIYELRAGLPMMYIPQILEIKANNSLVLTQTTLRFVWAAR
jgi:hypothetical protein